MSLNPGLRVRIHPSMKGRLPPPYNRYAESGRVGVLVEEIESGAWRVAFEPVDAGAPTHYVVLRHSQLVSASRGVSTKRQGAQAGQKRRGLLAWLAS